MNEVLKQRLVGALILVALGVVFWPIIFIDPEQPAGSLEARIPPRPAVDTTPLPEPDQVGLRASPPLVSTEAEPVEPAPSDESPATALASDPAADDSLESASQEATEAVSGTADKDSQTRSTAPETPRLDEQGVPIAWMLQVVSVSRADRAEAARQRLQELGHKAYVKKTSVDGRTVHRVYVGPKFERARLESIRASVNAEFGVESMIRRYYP